MTTASAILAVQTSGVRVVLIICEIVIFDCFENCLLVVACYPLLPYELDGENDSSPVRQSAA